MQKPSLWLPSQSQSLIPSDYELLKSRHRKTCKSTLAQPARKRMKNGGSLVARRLKHKSLCTVCEMNVETKVSPIRSVTQESLSANYWRTFAKPINFQGSCSFADPDQGHPKTRIHDRFTVQLSPNFFPGGISPPSQKQLPFYRLTLQASPLERFFKGLRLSRGEVVQEPPEQPLTIEFSDFSQCFELPSRHPLSSEV